MNVSLYRRHDNQYWCTTANDTATAAAAATQSYQPMSCQPANKSRSGRLTAAVWTASESGSSQSNIKLRSSGAASGSGTSESDTESESSESGDWKPRTDSFHSHAKLWLQHYRAARWWCSDTAELSGNSPGESASNLSWFLSRVIQQAFALLCTFLQSRVFYLLKFASPSVS